MRLSKCPPPNYIYIYIYIFRPAGRVHGAPLFCAGFWSTTHWCAKGVPKMAKRDTKCIPKTQTASGAVLGCQRTSKGYQNGHQEHTKTPNMAPRGARMRLKGAQICPTNSLKERCVFETALGPVLCRQKGPKRVPISIQNGLQNRTHCQTFSCINLELVLAPVGDPK